MWRQIGGQPSAVANEDEEIEEEEDPVSTHFNTNKFGNFLEVRLSHSTLTTVLRGALMITGILFALIPHACRCLH